MKNDEMISVKLDRKGGIPLYAQLRDAIGEAIRERSLAPGDRLPAVASLAKQLKVTASTVRRAFRDLLEAGSVSSHVGRGTFVADPSEALGAASSTGRSTAKASPVTSSDPELSQARRLRMGVARNLEGLMALTGKPGLIRFTSGVPAPDTVRPGLLEKLVAEALKKGQAAYEGYCRAPGLPELRQAVADRFRSAGTEVAPDQVLITSGSQQAVALLGQSALESNRRIFCEVPCYSGIFEAFGAMGHWVESVPRDFEGPDPDRLADLAGDGASMLYVCPELQNPMGVDLTPQRRRAVVEWVAGRDALLISDEIFHDLHFDGGGPKSLLSDAGPGRTVAIGSLSKSFMCGLRIGWLVSHRDRILSLLDLKNAMDLGCPPLMQGIADALLRSGEYDAHLRNVRRLYKERCDAALEALDEHMPDGVVWTHPAGGFQMWCELPTGYSSLALFLLAVERGVAFLPGPLHDVDHRFVNGFRLAYGSLAPDEIAKGVSLLADAVKELLRHPASDPGLSGVGSFV